MGNSTLNCIIQSDERNCQDWGFASFCEKGSLRKEGKMGRKERTYKPNNYSGFIVGIVESHFMEQPERQTDTKTDVFPWWIVCKNQKNQGVILNINTGQILCKIINHAKKRLAQ